MLKLAICSTGQESNLRVLYRHQSSLGLIKTLLRECDKKVEQNASETSGLKLTSPEHLQQRAVFAIETHFRQSLTSAVMCIVLEHAEAIRSPCQWRRAQGTEQCFQRLLACQP